MTRLWENHYCGFLAVEPHAFMVDGRGELYGPEGMSYAVGALRKILASPGGKEQAAPN